MPYNEGTYGNIIRALTLSLYGQDYESGIHPTPPTTYFLVDFDDTYIVDFNGDFIAGVL